jgi:6-phosphogluconolactonase
VLFLIAGDPKREAVARWRAGERNTPARAIRARAGVDVLVEAKLLSNGPDMQTLRDVA